LTSVPTSAPTTAGTTPALGTPKYIATTGSDTADGSIGAPYATLQKCIDGFAALGPGSSCLFRGGEYFFTAVAILEHLDGTSTDQYLISAYADETVTIIGMKDVIEGGARTWRAEAADFSNGGAGAPHWSIELAPGMEDPWQLFVGDELMINARWPNARWSDKTVFSSETWGHSASSSTYYPNDPTTLSLMVDAAYSATTNLATWGGNATSATAILNIGHWVTVAGSVATHTAGSATFGYYTVPGWKANKYVASHSTYYLENKLQMLDIETEWWYDQTGRRIHVLTNGNISPAVSGLRVQARVQTYALRMIDVSWVTVSKLNFIGTTVWAGSMGHADSIYHITLRDLTFKYPSTMKRMLGDETHAWPTTLHCRDKSVYTDLNLINNSFTGSEADPIIQLSGVGNLIENNKFEWNDWTAISTVVCFPPGGVLGNSETLRDRDLDACDSSQKYGGGAFALQPGAGTISNPTIVRRNTLSKIGPSAGIRCEKNTIVTLNHVYDIFDIQLDGALIQGGANAKYEQTDKSVNWAPPLCTDKDKQVTDATLCNALAGCTHDGGTACSGWPTSLVATPADAMTCSNAGYSGGAGCVGVLYEKNWVHNGRNDRTSKRGLRFDRSQDDCNGRFGKGGAFGFYGRIKVRLSLSPPPPPSSCSCTASLAIRVHSPTHSPNTTEQCALGIERTDGERK
jgi:hypothetical protein